MAKRNRMLGVFLADLLLRLAAKLGCEADALQLDHDPALAARQFNARTGIYVPDANDPDHLIYREKHAHLIKTNTRGDGAQHPDRVLIKRERRRRKGKGVKKLAKSSKHRSRGALMRRGRAKKGLVSYSAWPNGSRKIQGRNDLKRS
jgi:hypothetical protein